MLAAGAVLLIGVGPSPAGIGTSEWTGENGAWVRAEARRILLHGHLEPASEASADSVVWADPTSDATHVWADVISASAFDHRSFGSLRNATRSLWPYRDAPAARDASETGEASEVLLWQFYDRDAEEGFVSREELMSQAWLWISHGLYRAGPTQVAALMEGVREQAATR